MSEKKSSSPTSSETSAPSPTSSETSAPSPTSSEEIDLSPSASEEVEFDELFDSFCRVGDRGAEEITLRNVDKWFKQANLFTKDVTTTDTAIIFAKVAKNKRRLSRGEFLEMMKELAEVKEIETEDLRSSLVAAGKPSFTGITKPIRGSIAADNMERLSNPSSYTGTHRQRFDAEGKGLGLSGRYDVDDTDGYVHGYKNKGSYGSIEQMPKEDEEDPTA